VKYRQSVAIQLAILALVTAFSVFMAFRLPDVVPTHWGIGGKPDAWGSKWINLSIGPFLTLVSLVLTLVLPRVAPRQFAAERMISTFGSAMVLVSMLMGFISVVILKASGDPSFDLTVPLMAVLFAFVVIFGRLMHGLKRNAFMGIRTKWTLSSDAVWDETHRQAALVWEVVGAAGFILTLLHTSLVILVILLLITAFAPIWLSYRIYRRLNAS
jgi:uncharacterized membrane protein